MLQMTRGIFLTIYMHLDAYVHKDTRSKGDHNEHRTIKQSGSGCYGRSRLHTGV